MEYSSHRQKFRAFASLSDFCAASHGNHGEAAFQVEYSCTDVHGAADRLYDVLCRLQDNIDSAPTYEEVEEMRTFCRDLLTSESEKNMFDGICNVFFSYTGASVEELQEHSKE